MTAGIMQPYMFPYIGYYQLINAVDKFILYDNIEYTKKGWINRNRILSSNVNDYITFPLKKDSDYLHINQRFLSDSFSDESKKLLRKIKETYKKGKHFDEVFPLVEDIITYKESNLFYYIYNSILQIAKYLQIETEFIISSKLKIDHTLRSENKVIALCKAIGAQNYVNPIGGVTLYSKEKFQENAITLKFIKSDLIEYKQFNNNFIPWLSIIDVLMFNSKDALKSYLQSYTLV